MFALSMIASLAGTPLRIAEAAHDIGCALADRDDAGALEIPDGGVGDDSGATTKGEATDPSASGHYHAAAQPMVIDPSTQGAFCSSSSFGSPSFRYLNELLSRLQRYRC